MKLKLCGLRRHEDIEMINEVMPDCVGFIFAPTRRYVSPTSVRELCRGLAAGIKKVGVFVNSPIGMLVATSKISGVDAVQLHGDETAEYIRALRKRFDGEIWKAVRVRKPEDIKKAEQLPVDMLLYDSFVPGEYGGTGKEINLGAIIAAGPKKPFYLAGGINAGNLDEILSIVQPYGIDISSGFEVDGYKSKDKLGEIMNKLKGRYR